MQAKLLRVLQEHEIKRVGGNEPIKIDVRIVAATNKNLEGLVEEKKFREDLFYRLNVVALNLPSLRERAEDIHLLADHFLRKFAEENKKAISQISPEAMDLLLAYGWPGNVRELENVIERSVTLSHHSVILPEDLPRRIRAEKKKDLAQALPSHLPLAELEKIYIQKILEETGGNKKKAADILGIDRRTLYRMAARYGLSIKG
jgi:two-component system response regulator AtoC